MSQIKTIWIILFRSVTLSFYLSADFKLALNFSSNFKLHFAMMEIQVTKDLSGWHKLRHSCGFYLCGETGIPQETPPV